MTPTAFIAKWRANARNERAATQEHFLDLCALLDEPTPNSDPTGAAYAFEKGATKASGGEGWADPASVRTISETFFRFIT